MAEKMSVWGVGPRIGRPTFLYALAAGVATYLWPSLWAIRVVRYRYLLAGAAMLLALAAAAYPVSIFSFWRGYREGRLVTTGMYALCRHPLYAIWILLILPAVALLLRSWLFLTTSVFMYLVTRVYLHREEEYLQELFGREYAEYKRRVNAIFPTLWK